jgi:DNA-binding MurR/RpiR family transcriptional regulator
MQRCGWVSPTLAVLAPVDKLRRSIASGARQTGAAETLDTARRQLALLDVETIAHQCKALAGRIMAARAVHIMGFGLSAHLASMAVLGLQPFHPAVSAVVEFGGTENAAGRLTAIGKPDLLIAMTFPRYSREVVALTRYAHDKGASIVALTDSVASPIATLADDLLLAPAEHSIMSSSFVAAMAIVEALIATVMLSDPRNVGRADRLTEAIGAYLHDEPRVD